MLWCFCGCDYFNAEDIIKNFSEKLVLIYKPMRGQNSQDDQLKKMFHKNLKTCIIHQYLSTAHSYKFFFVLTVFPEVYP